MKFCKKIISLILAVLMATSALTVVDFSAYADYKNGETSADFDADTIDSTSVSNGIYSSSCALSEASAMDFLKFLFNENLSESKIRSSKFFPILVGKFSGTEDEYRAECVALSIFVRARINENVDDSSHRLNSAYNYLYSYLSDKLKGMKDVPQEVIEEYKAKAMKVVEETILDLLINCVEDTTGILVTEEHLSWVNAVNDGVNKAEDLSSQVFEYLEYAIAAIHGCGFVIAKEHQQRYWYFNSYLSNRPSYSSASDAVFKALDDSNFDICSQNSTGALFIDSLSWVTGKNSWVNHRKEIQNWAEFVYQIEKCASAENKVSKIFEYNGHTYQFFNTRFSSFEEAEIYCESLGGHLAVIESRDEDKNVYGFLRSLGEMNAFLGVKKNTDGIWVDVYGNVLNKNSYTNWGAGEPNNEGGCEDVLQYYKAYPNGEWNDLYWGKQGIYSFICEWDEICSNIVSGNHQSSNSSTHKHIFKTEVVKPTCEKEGYTKYRCTDCNYSFVNNYVSATGHDYKYSRVTDPTCTEKGYDLYNCSVCGKGEKIRYVAALGHKYVFVKTVASSCTSKRYDLYKCSRCNVTEKRNYKDALGHNYVFTLHKDPTCNSKGYDEYTCSRCNGTKRDEIAALDGSALTSALDDTKKKMESGVFTDESVSACQKVCDKYQNAVNELHSQAEVDNATAEVTSAYENLVLKDIVTGTLDNGMTWTFTKDGAKLSFAGEGEVPYYAIGSNPWYYCGNIETLEFGEGITSIAGSAFTKYNTVKKINFPSTLTTINIRAFEYCYAVEELVIPDSVTFIGYGTFASLTSLKRVTVPASVGYASYAFEHDEQVEKIIITPGVDGIMPECIRTNNIGFFGSKYTGAFGPWRVAKNAIVTVQDGITSIGLNTFYNAVSGNLTINIPASVNNIGKTCFATNGKTVAYVENGNCVIDETNLCSSNVNVMVKSENGEYAQKSHIHTWSDWHYNNDAVYNSSSDYKDGTQTRTCSVCGESETKEAPNTALLRRRGNALSLESSITLATYITKDVVDYYDEVYAEFTRNGKTEKVYPSDKTLTSNSTVYCIFDYTGISPQALGDNVSITFYGIKDGVTYNGNAYKYSATDYIKSTLNKPTSSAKLKTLLVDLVYYGEACQVYQNYKTDNLLTDILTDEQKAFHSTGDLNLTNIKNSKYSLCDNRLVKFGTALRLNNSVKMAIAMNMTNVTLEELSLKVKKGSRTMTYSYSKNPENFGKGKDGYWYFYFDGVYANQMSDEVLITAYKGSEQVSYTLKYSVESYAAIVTDAKIKAVTDAMMRYGNSAKAYVGK